MDVFSPDLSEVHHLGVSPWRITLAHHRGASPWRITVAHHRGSDEEPEKNQHEVKTKQHSFISCSYNLKTCGLRFNELCIYGMHFYMFRPDDDDDAEC